MPQIVFPSDEVATHPRLRANRFLIEEVLSQRESRSVRAEYLKAYAQLFSLFLSLENSVSTWTRMRPRKPTIKRARNCQSNRCQIHWLRAALQLARRASRRMTRGPRNVIAFTLTITWPIAVGFAFRTIAAFGLHCECVLSSSSLRMASS